MSSRLYFLLLLTGLLGPNVISTQSDNVKFTVISTTEPSQRQNEYNLFEEQLQIRTALIETKFRLEAFDLKINQIQKTLDELLKLQGVKSQEAPTISKIEEVIENKQEKQMKIWDTKLGEVKQQVVEEIGKRNRELAELYEVNIEQVKKEIVASLSTEIGILKEEIKLFDNKLNGSTNQLKKDKKQIVEDFEKVLEQQLHRHSNKLQAMKLPTTETPTNIPKSCKEIQERGNNVSGVYSIQPKAAPEAFNVLCNMETRGGGWTYVLNRFDGSQEFYLNWTDYKQGFGNLTGEFWLGLEHLYELTGTNGSELLVELADWEGKSVYAHFTNFSIASEQERYTLKVLTGYSGDAGNSFIEHVGSPFLTPDRQQGANGYCPTKFHGAWWYLSGCFHVKLTGKYITQSYAEGMHWRGFHGYSYSLKQARMMIKP